MTILLSDRLQNVTAIADLDAQLHKAKAYITRLKNKVQAEKSLADKISAKRKVVLAEWVLRNLRHSFFDIEDCINSQDPSALETLKRKLCDAEEHFIASQNVAGAQS